MNFKEHENNHFVKQKDKIEKYLLRIIQRYFDIENNFTKESVEAIINESLTRLKQDIINEKGFMFSLNQKTGHLVLTIQDFGGETVFDKHSAFNKDFGNQDDTVCEGNDIRLSDNREPLMHTHNIIDIKKIEEKLKAIDVKSINVHIHNNKNILDMIEYTGTKVQIDLIIIEQIEIAINHYYNSLIYKQEELQKKYDKTLNTLINYKTIIEKELANVKNLIESSTPWLNDIKNYINTKIKAAKNNVINTLTKYVSKDKIQDIMQTLSASYYIVNDGEIPIPNGVITCNPRNYDVLMELPNNASSVEETITLSVPATTNIINPKAKFYFRYDNEETTITIPLPFCTKNGDRIFLIEGSYDAAGNLSITSRHIKKLPCPGTNDNIYNENTIIIESQNDALSYDAVINKLTSYECQLCLIDSETKNTFVKGLLHNETYFIQGYNFSPSGTNFVDNQGNILSYFDWDEQQPILDNLTNQIYVNQNKKWAIVEDRYADKHNYVLEYKIKRLADFYKNPRIYYQILGNKEE